MKTKRALPLLAALCLTVLLVPPARAGNGNWGLSFPKGGGAPLGGATAEYLAKYDAAYLGDTGKKVIYLTFDAGYENGSLPPILDALKKHSAPAAFFVVGHFVKSAPELTRRLCEEGHVVGNHTFHHPDMSKIADEESFRAELAELETLFRETTGREMSHYYRPPQGKYRESNLAQAQRLGYKTVFWSLAYVDWIQEKQPTREQALAKLTARIHPGAVVLLHSTSQTNAEIMDDLLTRWESEGYTFGHLDDLFA
ncbi:MAG: polysaccharide deacetylase family protein [Oscillospiraceae bacterium]|nr:polysaccharide deacetylase family protein [Oscillospiraceae bacterium]